MKNTENKISSERLYSVEDIHKIIRYMHKNYSKIEDELAIPYTDNHEDLPDGFFDSAYNICLKRAIETIV